MSLDSLLLYAAVWLVAAMTGAWTLQRATGNCGWVDAVWSGATGLGGAIAALVPLPGAAGSGGRQVLAAAMVLLWGARLAWHIGRRTPGAPEDARYAALRREWAAAFEARLLMFLMIQAAAAWVLVAAVVLAARNPAAFPRVADVGGLLVLATAVFGEGRADAQMRRFRARGGGVCDQGLWGVSRHPNYFFEFLGWCAYPLLALNAPSAYPQGALSLGGPVLMFVLLRYVSGVPPLEKSMLARRGDAFAAYQERVSVFFPLPQKWIPK